MKKNRTIFLVFVMLAVAALVLWLTRSPTTFRRTLSDFKLGDSSNVTRIFMADKNNNSVTLAREATGKWTVDGRYPAQKQSIDLLLKTMVDIEVQQPVAIAAHDNIIKELAVNAIKVEIYQWVYRVDLFGWIRWFPHEKLTKVYYVGGATQNNQGCFMLMEGSDEPFVIFLPGFRGFVSPRYSPFEKYWRDYNIFRKTVPEIASVKVEVPGTPDYSYEVKNNGDNRFTIISLSDGKALAAYDTLKLLNFLAGFRNLNYEALLNDMDKAKKDSILSSQPFIILTLTDTAGVSNTIKTYHKKGPEGQADPQGNPLPYDLDRLYALVNGGKDFTLIQYFTFDKVLRPKFFFFREAKETR
jgi:hypothetical protein